MKTCFVSRLGGCGDILHCSHLPKLIKEYYKVDRLVWETNYNGFHIFENNPYIDELQFVEVEKMSWNRMSKHLEHCRETYDLVFDLSNTIEKQYCTNENDQRYYRSDSWRREKLGKISYYDVMTRAIGLPDSYFGNRGQLWYKDEEHKGAQDWANLIMEKYNCDFIVLINLSGSTLHKKFIQAESVARNILEWNSKAMIYLTGDEFCKSQVFEGDRIRCMIDKWNFRTVALNTKYVDLTISLESGLALVAHYWDAPCLHLLTAASCDNHCKYAKNAYWLQAETACSPCHRNPREYFGCPIRDKHPACIFFNVDKIIEKVKEVYEVSNKTLVAV